MKLRRPNDKISVSSPTLYTHLVPHSYTASSLSLSCSPNLYKIGRVYGLHEKGHWDPIKTPFAYCSDPRLRRLLLLTTLIQQLTPFQTPPPPLLSTKTSTPYFLLRLADTIGYYSRSLTSIVDSFGTSRGEPLCSASTTLSSSRRVYQALAVTLLENICIYRACIPRRS